MDLFNSLDKSLSNLDKAIHSKMEGSFVDNFLHELQNHLAKMNSVNLLPKLHWMTSLHFTGYDGNFARCVNYNDQKIYFVPKNNIIGDQPKLRLPIKNAVSWKILCKLYWNSYERRSN